MVRQQWRMRQQGDLDSVVRAEPGAPEEPPQGCSACAQGLAAERQHNAWPITALLHGDYQVIQHPGKPNNFPWDTNLL